MQAAMQPADITLVERTKRLRNDSSLSFAANIALTFLQRGLRCETCKTFFETRVFGKACGN